MWHCRGGTDAASEVAFRCIYKIRVFKKCNNTLNMKLKPLVDGGKFLSKWVNESLNN